VLEKEGYDVMGAAFEVYNALGSGFLEEVYQQALEIEFENRFIPFLPQQQIKLRYKERVLKKTYQADLVAFGTIIIELKAVSFLAPEHMAQLMNYLKASRLTVGYLINFGSHHRLEWRRIALE
jgi:GxxExxY protein